MSNHTSSGLLGSLFFYSLGDHARAVGDQSVDQCHVRAIGDAFEVIRHGHIAWHEDVRFDSGGGGVGGERSGGVAC